jgi:PKD repeat protein
VRLRAITIVALLTALVPVRAGAETVLLLGGDTALAAADAATALTSTGLFAPADVTELATTSTPVLSDLTPHDIVLVWSSAGWDDPATLGDVLADAVDAGVEIVLAGNLIGDGLPGGRLASDGYSPVLESTVGVLPGDLDFSSPDTDPSHPSLLALVDVGYPDLGQGLLTPSAVGTTFAVDTGGGFVGVEVCDRRVVAVVLDPPSLVLGGAATDDARLWLGQLLLATQTTLPSAAVGGPYTAVEGASTDLDGTASTAGTFDPISFAWDLDEDGTFDDAAVATPTFAATALDGPSSVAIGLQVTDACGRTAVDEGTVTITNAPPQIISATQDGPADEAASVTFAATASDPGGDAVTFTWDFDDGSPTETGATVSHAYADDGTFTVSLSADDGDGGSDATTLSVTVHNVPPTIDALVGDSAVVVGETAFFVGSASDVAGPADPLTWSWSWGDGSPDETGLDLTAVSHDYAAPGTFPVTVSVSDGDGGTAVQGFEVVVSNPGPSLSLVLSPGTLNEAESGSFAVAASDVVGGTVTVAWDWGDGSAVESGIDLVSTAHAYADDGGYTATVTATDTFGAEASLSIETSVANLPPTITSSPGTTAEEGTLYIAALEAADVAADLPDLLWIAVAAPAGAAFDPGAATFTWLPSLSESLGGSVAFEVLVSDGDGGTDGLSWTVTAQYEDFDADGMADSWEVDHSLDPTVDDSLGDPDADGVSNLDEWLAGTDPQIFGGPSSAVPLAPLGGASVTVAQPLLRAANASDPDGDVLTYEFEIYDSVSLTSLVDSSGSVAEGSGGETTWIVTAPLTENTEYVWRVRAADARVAGPWSPVEALFVDVTNDPPDVPTPLSPDQSTVDLPLPGFVVAVGGDPEGDDFEVEIELVDETDAAFVDVVGDGFAEDGTWLASPAGPLAEDHAFSWRARARDVRGGTSAWSDPAVFEVDVSNTPPEVPTVIFPGDGTAVATPLPQLVVATTADPDGDPITVVFTVDPDPAFASDDRQDLGPAAPTDGMATVQTLSELPENTVVSARARAEDDRGGASAWVVWSFLVDATNEPPEGPRIIAPTDTAVVNGEALQIRWAPATDPDGDELAYELTVAADPDGDALWAAGGLSIPDGEVEGLAVVDVAIPPGAWRVVVRVTDGDLEASSPAVRFVVLPIEGSPADLGPGEEPYGCACESSVGGRRQEGGSTGLMLLLLGLGLSLRIARRRPR